MPSLLVLSTDAQRVEREITLADAEVTIGRDRENVLMLVDDEVSRRHARVAAEAGGYVVRDEGSANGVWLDDRRLAEHRLAPGDVFRIGSHQIAFCDGDAQALLAARQRSRSRAKTGRAGTRRDGAERARSGVPPWAMAAGLLAVVGGLGAAGVYASRSLWLPLLGGRSGDRPAPVVQRSTLAPPGIAEFGRLARLSEVRTISLGPEAREQPLGDTVRLMIPAGTVTTAVPFETSVFELELQELSTRVHSARAYVLEAAEGARLAKPLSLEIAWPSSRTSVAEHAVGSWRAIAVAEGSSTRVAIERVSRGTLAVVEWDEVPPAATAATRAVPAAATAGAPQRWPPPSARTKGVARPAAAAATRNSEELCAEVVERVLAYPNVSFERPLLQGAVLPPPRPGLPVGDPLAALMIADAAPAALGRNVYVRLTGEPAGERRSREQRLAQAVVASEDELRPAEVMALSLRACDGSFPLAALTAHNLLKGAAHPPPRTATASMPDPGELAAKLVELRPAGDKASLWYHAFVPLSVAAWTGDADEADAVLTKEYGLRFLGSLNGTGTAADSELQANGRCFARAARTILARRAETAAPAAAAGAPATAPGGAGSLAGEARLMLMPFEPVLVSADQGETPDLRADLERAMCIPGIHRGTPQIRVGRDGSFGVDCGLERNEPGDRAATTGRISGRVELGTGQPSFSGGSTQLQEFTLEVAGTLQSVTHTTSYRSVVRQTEKDRRGRASKVLGKMRYDHQRTTPRGEIHRYTAEVPFEMTLRYD